jgi:hypothetical protein
MNGHHDEGGDEPALETLATSPVTKVNHQDFAEI